MITKAKSGEHEVISFGSIISFKKEPITIILSVEKDPLSITFLFINDENIEKLNIFFQSTGTHSLNIMLNKFHESIGSGNKEPIRVGHINNKALYVNFRVYGFVESDTLLHYSFYLGEDLK